MTMHDDLRALSTAKVYLVTGLPCSGKTTYVAEHATRRAVVIDYDAIAVALGSPDSHDHPKSLVPYILHARDALLTRIADKRPTTDVWIITTTPRPNEVALADEIIHLDTDAATCKARALAAGRPARWTRLIEDLATRISSHI